MQDEYRRWKQGLSPEAIAKDHANNKAQGDSLLAYALAMGWLEARASEADARIDHVTNQPNAHSCALRARGGAAGQTEG